MPHVYQDRDAWIGEYEAMVLQHLVPGVGYHQGLILKEWNFPLRDNRIKTRGKVWRAVIAWKWNDPEAYAIVYRLAKQVQQLDV